MVSCASLLRDLCARRREPMALSVVPCRIEARLSNACSPATEAGQIFRLHRPLCSVCGPSLFRASPSVHDPFPPFAGKLPDVGFNRESRPTHRDKIMTRNGQNGSQRIGLRALFVATSQQDKVRVSVIYRLSAPILSPSTCSGWKTLIPVTARDEAGKVETTVSDHPALRNRVTGVARSADG